MKSELTGRSSIFAIVDDGTGFHHTPQQIDNSSSLAMALSGAEGRVASLHQATCRPTWDRFHEIYVPLVIVEKADVSPTQANDYLAKQRAANG